MTQAELEKELLSFPAVGVDSELAPGIRAFRVIKDNQEEAPLFALIYEGTQPLRLALKTDPQLALRLREKYESVLPSENLDQKIWSTIIWTGQLTAQEVLDIARHSYGLVSDAG